MSHNAPFRIWMCTFLFWMEHCGIGTGAFLDLRIRSITCPYLNRWLMVLVKRTPALWEKHASFWVYLPSPVMPIKKNHLSIFGQITLSMCEDILIKSVCAINQISLICDNTGALGAGWYHGYSCYFDIHDIIFKRTSLTLINSLCATVLLEPVPSYHHGGFIRHILISTTLCLNDRLSHWLTLSVSVCNDITWSSSVLSSSGLIRHILIFTTLFSNDHLSHWLTLCVQWYYLNQFRVISSGLYDTSERDFNQFTSNFINKTRMNLVIKIIVTVHSQES